MPTCLKSSIRRGEPEARTSLCCALTDKAFPEMERLFETVGNATLGQVVRGHFYQNLITCQNTNAVFTHAACRVRNDFVFIFELYAKHCVWEQLRNNTWKLEDFFFRHAIPVSFFDKNSPLAGLNLFCAEPI